MRWLASFFAALALLCAAPAAEAAMTATLIGSVGTSSGVSSLTVTIGTCATAAGGTTACPGNSCASGAFLAIALSVILGNNHAIATITDSTTGGSNTYTIDTQVDNAGGSLTSGQWITAPVTHAFANTNTITIPLSTTSTYNGAEAICITGQAASSAVDIAGTGTSGASANPSWTAATLAQANEMVLGLATSDANTAPMTEASGYTNLDNRIQAGGNGYSQENIAYKTVSATTAPTYNPTIIGTPTHNDWTDLILTVKQAAAAGAPPTRSLLGVGQ